MIDEDEIRRRVHRRLRMDEHAALLDAREEAAAQRSTQHHAAGPADAGRGGVARGGCRSSLTSDTPLIVLSGQARAEAAVAEMFGAPEHRNHNDDPRHERHQWP